MNKDIIGSMPQCVKFKTERKDFNPLEPKYNLAKYQEILPLVPKFIRNGLNIDDIDRAHPKRNQKRYYYNGFKNQEIEGAKAKKKKIRNSDYNNIDYSDVTNFKFTSKRNSNPLDPEYLLDYGKGEKFIHGNIEGSKPTPFHPMIYSNPMNLKTDDVPGAQIGTKNKFNKFTSMNHNLNLSDIHNAQSGSLKKGINTFRKTNPLNPEYKFPGNVELSKNNNNNPYADTLHLKKKPNTVHMHKKTPGELATLERLEKMQIDSMNNPINGKIK
jgi:hypothetical protein